MVVQKSGADKNPLATGNRAADQISMVPRNTGTAWNLPIGSSNATRKAPGAQSSPAIQSSVTAPSEFYDFNYSGRKTVEMNNGIVYAGGFLDPNGKGQYAEGSLWVTGITEVAAFCSYNLNTKTSSSKYSIFGNGSGAEMLDWTLSAGPSVCPRSFTDMTRFALPSSFLGKVKVIDFNLGGSQRPGAGSYE